MLHRLMRSDLFGQLPGLSFSILRFVKFCTKRLCLFPAVFIQLIEQIGFSLFFLGVLRGCIGRCLSRRCLQCSFLINLFLNLDVDIVDGKNTI